MWNQNSFPFMYEPHGLDSSFSSPLGQSQRDQNADLRQLAHMETRNVIVITTKMQSFQIACAVFKDHFLNHDMFSSFDFFVD